MANAKSDHLIVYAALPTAAPSRKTGRSWPAVGVSVVSGANHV
jgi:hypothetical protein